MEHGPAGDARPCPREPGASQGPQDAACGGESWRAVESTRMSDLVDIDPEAILYAVHAADGSRLAILDDRKAAFAAARGHELDPMSVH